MTRAFSTGLLTVLAIAVLTSGVYAEALNSTDTNAVVEGNTSFAFDLYKQLKDAEGNLFFSPYSISTALAMTYAGARGKTEKQMAGALHFTLDQKRLHPAFACLEAQFNAAQNRDIELNVANALWAQKDYVFLKEFLDLTAKNYGAAPNHVDFKRDCETARKEINAWVEQKTKNKIKDLIKRGVLDPLTRLVLTNAIYFKGNWGSQFNKSHTKEEPFRPATGKSVKVPLMTQTQEFRYTESDSLQILELPYVGDDLSMIVLLPGKIDGLAQLEADLNPENLNAWMGLLRKREVVVFLPKFKMTSQLSLAETLASMGMPDAFRPNADFSGMDGTKTLYISAVVHKAFVDVNEEGTEAAAATGVVMRLTSALPTPPPVFRADHPFVFLIRDNHSGSILFLGRIVDPT
ncbi:MAG: serpin family protein [Deltaproteobacteria bacterium]|nr:serpin family protein [Deltaproteobacteria bacterium]